MEHFNSDGVDIAYEVFGQGDPVLLIHGFASNGRINWGSPGWVKFLTERGRQVIVIDNRGHGESEKLYDREVYGAEEMANDAARLLDHLDVAKVDVMGYSMGARISAFLTIYHPQKVNSAVLAGLAYNMVRGMGRGDAIAQALEAEDESAISGAEPKAFRRFAVKTGSDLKALAACMRSTGHKITMEMLGTIGVPVLVVAGDVDDVAGPVEPLVEAIRGATGVSLPGRDHMNAVGDKRYKQAVAEFWNLEP
jgi:pimeloyl-ACP methyl ester carboxylesterase